MEQDLLATFKPDGDALLRRNSKRIDDPTLEYIAKMDPVGSYVDVHLGKLRKIRDQGIVERPLEWKPREVLEFTRWTEPDAADRTNRRWELRGAQGHWARAFSCAALMRAYGDVETRQIVHGGYNAALIQLLESLRCLDAGFEPEAMAALAWFITRLRISEELGVEDEIGFAGVACCRSR